MTQRIIKFRAWCGLPNRMIENVSTGTIYIFGDKGEQIHSSGCIFMQFTGLLDKNGKEIYEGDIMKRFTEVNEGFGFDLCVVKWNQARCYYELDRANDQASYWGHMNGSHAKGGRYEVIGNIYDNPELLPPNSPAQ